MTRGAAPSDVRDLASGASRWRPVLAPLTWTAIVIFGASQPPALFSAYGRLPVHIVSGWGEVGAHVGAYLLLVILLWRAVRHAWPGMDPRRADVLSLAGASAVSVVTETLQLAVPVRAFELSDLALNSLGAGLGLGLLRVRRQRRVASRSPA